VAFEETTGILKNDIPLCFADNFQLIRTPSNISVTDCKTICYQFQPKRTTIRVYIKVYHVANKALFHSKLQLYLTVFLLVSSNHWALKGSTRKQMNQKC